MPVARFALQNAGGPNGFRFKALNNCDRNFTSVKLQRQMEEIEPSISRYLTAFDTADRL